MRYFVRSTNGDSYGPADVATLNQWAADKRLLPSSQVVEEMSGSPLVASAVPGIIFPSGIPATPLAPLAPPPPSSPYQSAAPLPPGASYYPRPESAPYPPAYSMTPAQDSGAKDMWSAFGIAIAAPIVGLLSIYGIVIAFGGIQFAWKAMKKGQKFAIVALILNIIAVPAAFYMRFILRYQYLYH